MKKIAFFDSGMGGLSVLQEALHQLPQESYLYFADSEHAPYGIKSRAEIEALVLDAVDFLMTYDLKALVVACNTATSVAIHALRNRYDIPIIGMEPAVKPALEQEAGHVLISATEATLKEAKLWQLVDQLVARDRVQSLSLQELVRFAEQRAFDSPEVDAYLANAFATIDWADVDTLVLGCTHFPYFRSHIRRHIPSKVRLIDGNAGTVRQLKKRLPQLAQNTAPTIEYFISKKAVPAQHFDYFFAQLQVPERS